MSMLVVDKINDFLSLLAIPSFVFLFVQCSALVTYLHWLGPTGWTLITVHMYQPIKPQHDNAQHAHFNTAVNVCMRMFVCVCVYTFVLSQLHVHTLQISELAQLNPHQDDDFSIIQYIPGLSYHSLNSD